MTMRNLGRTSRIAVIVIMAACLPVMGASADDAVSFKQLSAEWWQWAVSISPSNNPVLDATGGNCMVGQHGSVWFLAGNFGGTTTRTCAVPEGTVLFFPVLNSVNIDTPNVCGQGSESIPVADLRAASAAFIEGAANLSVVVDGEVVKAHHVQSQVFAVALPEDNVFDAPCLGAGLGNVPAGVYSPAVDEGFYVKLNPLDVGTHSVVFHAESGVFVADVTYNLTVVPVVKH
jgi:hypothetical protein